MNTKEKTIIATLIGIVITSSLTAAPAFAIASELPSQKTEVYTLEEDNQPEATVLHERGRCTDSYSKEWCDSHGFKNNRPVPHKVQLTKKEADCYYNMIRNGAEWFFAAVTKNVSGALFATADIAYTLHNCLS